MIYNGTGGPGRSRRAGRLAGLLAALASLALLAAGCGGSPPSAGGSPGSQTTSSSRYQEALAYAQCMRSHGIADFPDPDSSGRFVLSSSNGSGVDQSTPQYAAASKTCEKLLPNDGQMTPAQLRQAMAQALKYSACMRSHGLANYPDPTESDGGISFSSSSNAASGSGRPGSGPGPGSPQFQAARQACRHYLTGGPS